MIKERIFKKKKKAMTRNIKYKWVTLKRIMYGNILLLKSSRRFHIIKKKKKQTQKFKCFSKDQQNLKIQKIQS